MNCLVPSKAFVAHADYRLAGDLESRDLESKDCSEAFCKAAISLAVSIAAISRLDAEADQTQLQAISFV